MEDEAMPIPEGAIFWDNDRLRQDRLARLQDQMKRHDVGAMLLGTGPKARYVMNLQVPGGSVFVPANGQPLAVVRPRDLGYVKLQFPNTRLLFPEGLAAGAVQLMRDQGLAGERLAVEDLRTKDFLDLVQHDLHLVNALPIFEEAWSVKTQDELDIYRRIGEQYTTTMRAARDAIRPGVTENQLAGVVSTAWHDAGGEEVSQLNICVGDNMNPWRRWPTERAFQASEFVGVDLHGRSYAGLRGDASRTFFVGAQPNAEQRDLYKRAYDYLLAMRPVIQAGRSIAEIAEKAPRIPDEYREALWDLNLAHAIGVGPSGEPRLDPRNPSPDVIIQENQVLAVECYFGAKGGPMAVKLEDDIIVRNGEPELIGAAMPFDDRFIG